MKISIITLFPEVFEPILNTSILKRAQTKGRVSFELINLRDFGEGRHQVVDGRPYGGGVGMILKADTLTKALQSIIVKDKKFKISNLKFEFKQDLRKNCHPERSEGSRFFVRLRRTQNDKKCVTPVKLRIKNLELKTILMSASGTPYKQKKAQELSKLDHLIIICGHYEGVDQRFIEKYVDEEISIGDYILTGGEIPAMAIADSVVRLLPGVLEKPEATQNESFSNYTLYPKPYVSAKGGKESSAYTLLEHPQYTRPEEFDGKKVPKVLLSGNHGEIAKWRKLKSLEKTKKVRPDLLK